MRGIRRSHKDRKGKPPIRAVSAGCPQVADRSILSEVDWICRPSSWVCRGVDPHSGYIDDMARRQASGGEEQGCLRRIATGRLLPPATKLQDAQKGAEVTSERYFPHWKKERNYKPYLISLCHYK